MRIRAVLGSALFLLGFGYAATVQIPNDSEGVVHRGAEVLRVAPPGWTFHAPFLETVTPYQTKREQLFRFDEPFLVNDCAVTVVLAYRIGSVVLFHTSGADSSAISRLRPQVERALASLPAQSIADRRLDDRLIRHLSTELSGAMANGLQVVRPYADTSDCELPDPGGSVAYESGAELLSAPITGLGLERTQPLVVRGMTADGHTVEVAGVAGTYTVLEEDRFAACFGDGLRNRETASARIAQLTKHAIREQVQRLPLSGLGRLPAQVSASRGNTEEGFETWCGLRIQSVDFASTEINEQKPTGCDEGGSCGARPQRLDPRWSGLSLAD